MSNRVRAQKSIFILFLVYTAHGEAFEQQSPASMAWALKSLEQMLEESFLLFQQENSCAPHDSSNLPIAALTPEKLSPHEPTIDEKRGRHGNRGKLGTEKSKDTGGSSATPYTQPPSVTPIEDEIAHAVAMLILNSHELDSLNPAKRANEQFRMSILKDETAAYFMRLGMLGLNEEMGKYRTTHTKKAPASTDARPAETPTSPAPSGLRRSESTTSLNRFSSKS